MAVELEINARIATAESAKSLGELRKGLKDLVSLQGQVGAGTAEFAKLRKAINETEGKIGDLNDSFSTLRGSGVERLSSSFGLLKEGFSSFDGGKIKAAFQGIGSAMSAIPIFLIIEGVKLLIDNFDEVVEFFKDMIGTTNQYTKELERMKEANVSIVKDIDSEITALSGLKKNEEEVIALKRKKILLSIEEAKTALRAALLNQQLAQQELGTLEKLILGNSVAEIKRRADIINSQAETKKATEELKAQLASLQGFDNEQTQKKIDNNEKATKSRKEELEKQEEAERKAHEASMARLERQIQDIINAEKRKYELLAEERALEQETILTELAQLDKDDEERAKRIKEFEEKEKKDRDDAEKKKDDEKIKNDKLIAQSKIDIQKNIFEASKALSDAYFIGQLEKAKGNEKAELEIRKRMFQVDKAFNVARVVQDGIRSVQAALTVPPPSGQILAVVNAGLAAANVAKILATQFNPGSGSGGAGGGASVGNVGAGAVPINNITPNNNFKDLADSANETSNKQTNTNITKVVVVETDITKSQNQVKVIQNMAKVG